MSDKGAKHDTGKLKMELLPPGPIMDIAEVMTFGAQKYDDRNWEKGISDQRLYGALQRHLHKYWRGEVYDPEFGLTHLAHAACCIVFLMELHGGEVPSHLKGKIKTELPDVHERAPEVEPACDGREPLPEAAELEEEDMEGQDRTYNNIFLGKHY